MIVLVDASALVAMLTQDAEADRLAKRLLRHEQRLYCPPGAWEAVRAVARKRKVDIAAALAAVEETLADFDVRCVSMGETEWRLALDAHARYGKGTGHPARLNMGDCFAYACAKANDATLLYKGDDFVHTDLA